MRGSRPCLASWLSWRLRDELPHLPELAAAEPVSPISRLGILRVRTRFGLVIQGMHVAD